jgi:hypothetical protein
VAIINQTINGGATALPMRDAACVVPCAKPRLSAGIQFDMARVAVGNVAPSPSPSNKRAMISDTNPPASPVITVAAAQITAQTVSVRRGPNRSPTHPPIIWNTRYG